MALKTISSLVLVILFLIQLSFAEEDFSLRGIQNAKCTESEEAAKNQIFDYLAATKDLCPEGIKANQAEGWTCRKGGDCKKGMFRCNTQYRCGGPASTGVSTNPTEDTAMSSTPMITTPLPSPSPTLTPKPVPQASVGPMPTLTPTQMPEATPTVSPEMLKKIKESTAAADELLKAE